MKNQTIGMITSYPNIPNYDWLWHQTPHNFGQWGNIQILAKASKPDYLLMYQYDFPKPEKKSWLNKLKNKNHPRENIQNQLREVPKEKIIYLIREPPLNEVIEIHKYNYKQAQNYCGYISGPDDLAPTPNYMPAIWYLNNSFRDLNDLGITEKTKKCSWITSGITRSANHRHRLDFLRKLQENQIKFDLFGRNLPDWADKKGEIGTKWHSLAPYYYNLAIENYAENDWYVTEKLWDALLAWCLPIYYGGPAADKLLPPGSFLRLPNLDATGIEFIKEVIATPDRWHSAIPAITEARQIILHKLNLLNWLSEYVNIYQ